MTTTVEPDAPRPAPVLTPQCMVGQEYLGTGLDLGCRGCPAPRYFHPQLDMWIDVPCGCPHHAEATT